MRVQGAKQEENVDLRYPASRVYSSTKEVVIEIDPCTPIVVGVKE